MSDRLCLGNVELQPLDGTMHFYIYKGMDEPSAVRGEDTVVPGAAGKALRDRVKDHRDIELRGFVAGQGATEDAAREEYRDHMDALLAILDPTTTQVLVAFAPVAGVDSGRKRSITVRFVNMISGDWVAGLYRNFTLQFEAVASPTYPTEWVDASV